MTSSFAVSGFMATRKSTSFLRPTYPSLFARTVYHVGSPAMFDGNMFLPETGTPIWKMERRRTRFAVWLGPVDRGDLDTAVVDNHGSGVQQLLDGRADVRRTLDDADPCALKRVHFLGRRALASRNDSACMTHTTPRRGCLSRDEADDRLLERRLDPIGRILLGVAANFADHDHRIGCRVG